jgi:hypothetical protein
MSENRQERTYVEELEIDGAELVERVKALIKEGNVRRIIIRSSEGAVLLEIPLTAGVVVGGALTLFLPVLAALGAMAALLAEVKIQVVRTVDDTKGEPKA